MSTAVDANHKPGEAAFDVHGIEPVPDADRTSSALDQFWIWMGGNIAPINWILGALGIQLGLSLTTTLIVIVIGNVIGCTFFGLFALMGARTGVNGMVLSRMAFGRRGANFPAAVQMLVALGWIGVNTWVVLDLAMGALAEIGIHGGEGLRYAVAFSIMLVQVAVAVWGFYAIRSFERWTVPITAVVMAIMTVLAITKTDIVFNGGTVHGADEFTAITQLATAIGVGWAITWLGYAPDYSRFVAPTVSNRAAFWSAAAGMFISTVWLAALGAAIASAGSGTDPADIVVTTFGVMALPVLLLILHGPVATNILNFYTCSLAALTVGVKVARWKLSLLAGVISSAALVAFMQADSFATSFDQWMVSLVVWVSPWAAIVGLEYYVVRRRKVDVAQLYRAETRDRYGDINWRAVISLILGLIAGWSWQFGLVEAMQGPIAKAAGNSDFSWLTGSLVAGLSYWLLVIGPERRAAAKAPVGAPSEVPAEASPALAAAAASDNQA